MTLPTLRIQLLGPLAVSGESGQRPLPRSRKVRALLGFLSLTGEPPSRSRLCDLFWDRANDPRGELRWCLSKLRAVLGEGDERRLVAGDDDRVALDLSGCEVDALEVRKTVRTGVEHCADQRLRDVCALLGGELLEGLELDASAELTAWLSAERHRHRAMHVALARELVRRAGPASDEALDGIELWLRAAPFDAEAHGALLEALAAAGRQNDAEQHLAATIRAFEQEGVDWQPLRDSWKRARAANVPSAPVTVRSPAVVTGTTEGAPAPRSPQRASIAVMPFVERSPAEAGHLGDGLTEDVITRLAKLRLLFVIARGTVYSLAERGIGADEAARILDVDYVASGWVRRAGSGVVVGVELVDARSSRIVWTDELEGNLGEGTHVLDETADRIVAAIFEEIEMAERNRAVLKAPSSLTAWEAYHRGLHYMYRFNADDNRRAAEFLTSAVALDPTFARAYAALSFTHFQNAFLELKPDHAGEIDRAFAAAQKSVAADERDPAAHWAMGRALWLRGAQSEAVTELSRSVDLSPNFALGHYTLGFVHAQTGEPGSAIASLDYSRRLSPFDPLGFAMLASRALAHVRLGELDEAAQWALKATERPNAHLHILAIAAQCLTLAERLDDAKRFVSRIRERQPDYSTENFLRAFRFSPADERLFRRAAARIGFG